MRYPSLFIGDVEEATNVTYFVSDATEAIEEHFAYSLCGTHQHQPLPSLFAPLPPGYVEPVIVFPAFLCYMIQPEVSPSTPLISPLYLETPQSPTLA